MVKIHQLKGEIKDTLPNALSTLFKLYFNIYLVSQSFLGGLAVKNPPNAGDAGLTPWSGRSPREGNGSPPLQYSCLGNPMDRGAWQATGSYKRVRHGSVTKQQ